MNATREEGVDCRNGEDRSQKQREPKVNVQKMQVTVGGIVMRAKSIAVCCLFLISCAAFARGGGFGGGHYGYHSANSGEHYVHGYTRSDGAYVNGYHQTNPNGTKYDNWSSKGNVNPHTGKPGTVDPSK